MRVLFLFFFAFFLLFSLVGCGGSVEEDMPGKDRLDLLQFSEPGVYRLVYGAEGAEDVRFVRLYVVLPEGARFYLFDEDIPAGTELVSSDVDPSGDSIKEVVFSNAQDITYEYRVKVHEEPIVFSGVYVIDGMDQEQPILDAREHAIRY